MLKTNVTPNVLSKTSSGGCARGAGPLLRGEPAARQVPAPFAGARRASGVGGTRPPRLSPGGGNGKEGDPKIFPADLFTSWDWHQQSIKSQGPADSVPRKTPSFAIDSFRPFRSRVDSVLSSDPCLRPQLLHEPIPLTGCRNHYSASWARQLNALTRALTKEPVASFAARDQSPAW